MTPALKSQGGCPCRCCVARVGPARSGPPNNAGVRCMTHRAGVAQSALPALSILPYPRRRRCRSLVGPATPRSHDTVRRRESSFDVICKRNQFRGRLQQPPASAQPPRRPTTIGAAVGNMWFAIGTVCAFTERVRCDGGQFGAGRPARQTPMTEQPRGYGTVCTQKFRRGPGRRPGNFLGFLHPNT